MRRILSGPLALTLSLTLSLAPAGHAAEPAKALTPGDIVAAAHAADWVRIAPSDLMVMDLAPDAAGKTRRVVIQLMPAPFSQGWVENIRKLVAARWYDGIAVVRVQDNYVVQWGDPDGEDPKKAKALPHTLASMKGNDYEVSLGLKTRDVRDQLGLLLLPPGKDAYESILGFQNGWPIALKRSRLVDDWSAWPIHCYGMVGVGRGLSPDTGSGAELYTVIGTPPRQLDRNIALVGRVISGIEHLSSLPRGTGPLGFYETAAERVPIVSVRMGNEVADLPPYEYLSTESASFAAYADKRANRKDDFYIQPAGGVDICNVPVPVRVAGGAVKRVGM